MQSFKSSPATSAQYCRQDTSSTHALRRGLQRSDTSSRRAGGERVVQQLPASFLPRGTSQSTLLSRSSQPSSDHGFSDAQSWADESSYFQSVASASPPVSVVSSRAAPSGARPSTAAGTLRPRSLHASTAAYSAGLSPSTAFSLYTSSSRTPPSSLVDGNRSSARSEAATTYFPDAAHLPRSAANATATSDTWQTTPSGFTAPESEYQQSYYHPHHELLMAASKVSSLSPTHWTRTSAVESYAQQEAVPASLTAHASPAFGDQANETVINPTSSPQYAITTGLYNPSPTFPEAFQQLEIRIVGLGVRSWAPSSFRTWNEMMNVHGVGSSNSHSAQTSSSSAMRFTIMDSSGDTSQLQYDLRDSKDEADTRHVRSALFGGSNYRIQLSINRSIIVPLAQPQSDAEHNNAPLEFVLKVHSDQNDVLGVTRFSPPLVLKNGAWALQGSAVRSTRAVARDATTRQDPTVTSLPLYRPDDFEQFASMTPQMRDLGCIGKIFVRFVQTTAPRTNCPQRGSNVLRGIKDHLEDYQKEYDTRRRRSSALVQEGQRSTSGRRPISTTAAARRRSNAMSGDDTTEWTVGEGHQIAAPAPLETAYTTEMTSEMLSARPHGGSWNESSGIQYPAASQVSYKSISPLSVQSFTEPLATHSPASPSQVSAGWTEASSSSSRRNKSASRPSWNSAVSAMPTSLGYSIRAPPSTEVGYDGGRSRPCEDDRQQEFLRQMHMRLQTQVDGRRSSQAQTDVASFISGYSSLSKAPAHLPPRNSDEFGDADSFISLSNINNYAPLFSNHRHSLAGGNSGFHKVSRPTEDTASSIDQRTYVSCNDGASMFSAQSDLAKRRLSYKAYENAARTRA